MKQVLIYSNRKMSPVVWDASTPELEKQAFLFLFKYLDEEWQCYGDLEEEITMCGTTPREIYEIGCRKSQMKLYKKAKEGDLMACRRLLEDRKDYEYEYWDLVEICEGEIEIKK